MDYRLFLPFLYIIRWIERRKKARQGDRALYNISHEMRCVAYADALFFLRGRNPTG